MAVWYYFQDAGVKVHLRYDDQLRAALTSPPIPVDKSLGDKILSLREIGEDCQLHPPSFWGANRRNLLIFDRFRRVMAEIVIFAS